MVSGGTSRLTLREYDRDGSLSSAVASADYGRGQPDIACARTGGWPPISTHLYGPQFAITLAEVRRHPLAAADARPARAARRRVHPGRLQAGALSAGRGVARRPCLPGRRRRAGGGRRLRSARTRAACGATGGRRPASTSWSPATSSTSCAPARQPAVVRYRLDGAGLPSAGGIWSRSRRQPVGRHRPPRRRPRRHPARARLADGAARIVLADPLDAFRFHNRRRRCDEDSTAVGDDGGLLWVRAPASSRGGAAEPPRTPAMAPTRRRRPWPRCPTAGPVTYRVEFTPLWTKASFPHEYPDTSLIHKPHFSGLIGTGHNAGYHLFADGPDADAGPRAALGDGQARSARRRDQGRHRRRQRAGADRVRAAQGLHADRHRRGHRRRRRTRWSRWWR